MAAIKAKNQMSNELSNLLTGIASKSKTAAAELSRASSGSKNDGLNKMAHDLIKKADYIVAENQKDIEDILTTAIAKKFGKMNRTVKNKLGDQIAKDLYDIYHRSYDVPPPGGESIKMVETRVKKFIKDLLKKMKKEKVNVTG